MLGESRMTTVLTSMCRFCAEMETSFLRWARFATGFLSFCCDLLPLGPAQASDNNLATIADAQRMSLDNAAMTLFWLQIPFLKRRQQNSPAQCSGGWLPPLKSG